MGLGMLGHYGSCLHWRCATGSKPGSRRGHGGIDSGGGVRGALGDGASQPRRQRPGELTEQGRQPPRLWLLPRLDAVSARRGGGPPAVRPARSSGGCNPTRQTRAGQPTARDPATWALRHLPEV